MKLIYQKFTFVRGSNNLNCDGHYVLEYISKLAANPNDVKIELVSDYDSYEFDSLTKVMANGVHIGYIFDAFEEITYYNESNHYSIECKFIGVDIADDEQNIRCAILVSVFENKNKRLLMFEKYNFSALAILSIALLSVSVVYIIKQNSIGFLVTAISLGMWLYIIFERKRIEVLKNKHKIEIIPLVFVAKGSKVYHKSHICKAMTSLPYGVTERAAVKKGLRRCRKCYNKNDPYQLIRQRAMEYNE